MSWPLDGDSNFGRACRRETGYETMTLCAICKRPVASVATATTLIRTGTGTQMAHAVCARAIRETVTFGDRAPETPLKERELRS